MSLRGRVYTFVLASATSVLLAATVASAAEANPPKRTTEAPFDFQTSLFCGFPVQAKTLTTNEKITTFSDGRQIVTGRRTVRLTNLVAGNAMVITDAGHLETDPQQTVDTFTGRLFLPVFPGEPRGPGLWLFVGRVVASFATPGGFLYSRIDVTGSATDLCAALRE